MQEIVDRILLFVQINYTGPIISIESSDTTISFEDIDGEPIYSLTKHPELLASAIKDLRSMSPSDKVNLWLLRCLFLHQRLLENLSATLLSQIEVLIELLDKSNLPINEKTNFNIESALIYHYYKNNSKVNHYLHLAQESSGFTFKVSGALGKRTKFQTFDVTQLIIEATPSIIHLESDHTIPKTLDLNDDTLLESIKLVNDQESCKLNPLDQTILLSHCLQVENVNPKHGLTVEEMMVYISKVLENPNNWMIHTMALLLRSRLESTKSRTVERSCLQLQALVDQCQLNDPPASERLEFFFMLLIPPIWDLEKELAHRFVSIGVIMSAIEIFKRLEMWEDLIKCYQMSEKEKEAKIILNQLLTKTPHSPNLLCYMGDVTNDIDYYYKAWEYSHNRFSRAMRSLGAHYFKNQSFEKSIECYEKALEINPLFDHSWYLLGCACIKINDLDKAANAFNRVVSIDHENAEAWNNLASVYIRQSKKRQGWRALRESLKLMYDNRKIWQNYLFCCIDLDEIQESIIAMTRILDIDILKSSENKHDLDAEILEIMLGYILNDDLDANQVGCSIYQSIFEKLLNHFTQHVSNPELFDICSRFYKHTKSLHLAVEYLEKRYRLMLHRTDIITSKPSFEGLVNATLDLVQGYYEIGPLKFINRHGAEETCQPDYEYKSRTCLKTVIGRTKEWEDDEDYQKLVIKLQSLSDHEPVSR